jgi:DNA-binding beta-propeller fold protein YncE
VQSIRLEDVHGRIDHLAYDAKRQRLYVAALGADTIEVLDLAAGKRIQRVSGQKEPQGIRLLADLNRPVVASGEDGQCRFYDDAMKATASITGLDDADNVRYDSSTKRVYVGYGKGALAVIDAEKMTKLAEIPLDEHPESFQLETKGKRIFVNVPNAGHIAVIDREKGVVTAKWPVTQARANYPMALDETNHRLLIGCRSPAKMLVLDSESGKLVASLDCSGDTDDLFYDEARKRIYVTGGEGAISVFEQTDADHYKPLAQVTTAPGARTSLFVPESSLLYVAVPHKTLQKSEVRVFKVEP